MGLRLTLSHIHSSLATAPEAQPPLKAMAVYIKQTWVCHQRREECRLSIKPEVLNCTVAHYTRAPGQGGKEELNLPEVSRAAPTMWPDQGFPEHIVSNLFARTLTLGTLNHQQHVRNPATWRVVWGSHLVRKPKPTEATCVWMNGHSWGQLQVIPVQPSDIWVKNASHVPAGVQFDLMFQLMPLLPGTVTNSIWTGSEILWA